ncbi:MAG: serine/threonine protein kinase [Acidobacteria bacterium]|nr:MAG: serine/threonine protein kinase [Acidobacteriota bacterium]REK03257.1 MAG: serine/threonine protein kinase [Acidobacteriota bacterium]
MALSAEEISHWRRADEVLDELLELDSEERAAALARLELAPRVRDCVEQLLSASAASKSILDSPLPALAPGVDAGDLAGQDLGRWTLLEEIGRGGMAVVYRATRQEAGFTQTAAIKLLPRGTAGHVRFLREQQVLAGLEHPNIARFLDGGVSEDGTPWLAMELVEGVPLDEACQELDSRQKVRLLLPILDAVAYAHQRLIVHRDLKPGNLMVDHSGRARLLDFGIAKLLSDEQGDAATRVLTPGYAAPEQFSGGQISTATDVYGLGAVLHAVLTGDPVRGAGGERSRAMQAQRFDADLQNIVAKALREEPRDRYGTARELATDLERWLAGHPVAATPDSQRYRLRKFVGRHRNWVAAAAAVALVVVGAVSVVLWQARRTAEHARTVTAQNDVLTEILRSPQAVARGRQAKVVDVLAVASDELERRMPEPSFARARLYETLARTLDQLDDLERSIPLWEKAISDLDILGRATSSRAPVHYRLGLAASLTDARRFEEALEVLLEARQLARRLATDDSLHASLAGMGWYAARDHDPDLALELWEEAEDLAATVQWNSTEEKLRFEALHLQWLFDQGHYAQAIDVARAFLADSRAALGERHSHTLDGFHALANALSLAGHYREAEGVAAEGEAVALDWLGEDDRFVFAIRMSRANSIQQQHRYEESAELFRQLAETAEKNETLSPMDRLIPRMNLANSLQEAGLFAEAEPELLAAIDASRDLNGDNHPTTLMSYANLAELRIFAGRPMDALEPGRIAHEGLSGSIGAEHPITLFARATRAGALVNAGEPRQALELLEGLEEPLAAAFGADDPNVVNARIWRGQALLTTGRADEARPLIEDGYRWRLEQYGPEHPRTRRSAELVARLPDSS